jgi:hypothetical protein
VYSLKIGDEWRLLKGDAPHGDWEVLPTSPWNYALQIDTAHPERSLKFQTLAVGGNPFSPDGAPIQAGVTAKRLPSWVIERNAAGTLPQSPVHSSEPEEQVSLVPYGCTNLRITEFPLLK